MILSGVGRGGGELTSDSYNVLVLLANLLAVHNLHNISYCGKCQVMVFHTSTRTAIHTHGKNIEEENRNC